ncbi:MAG: protein kinase [Myxococcaceae bacterium]|nr:protein kinase [Myxococcaceae bacterium]
MYVSGQKVACSCGIRFEVKRQELPRPSRPVPGGVTPQPAATVGTPPDPVPAPSASPPTTPGKPAVARELPPASPSPQVDLGASLSPTVSPSQRAQGPAKPTMVAERPPEIPGYTLLELLGRGGMGEVWRARQQSLDREVALKLLPAKLAKDQEFISRFQKEITALATLSHPNITQIIDRGATGGHCFFVMELVVGKSLRELLGEARLAPAEALRIAAQVCRGIEHAHQRNIIHRDLKPENILLDAHGTAKVADFGLAGMRGSEKNLELTATAVAMGTVNYMAPEQRRDAKHVDHRADVYSLGVLLYEMLTGELPFGRFKLPSEKVRGLDRRVDEVVGRALEQDPEARLASAGELASALEALIPEVSNSVPPKSHITSPARPEQMGLSRLPGPWWSSSTFKAGALVVGALAALAFALKGLPRSKDVPDAPKAPAWYGDTEDDLFSTGTATDKSVRVDFEPGGKEELNAHAGDWRIDDGALIAVQYGGPTEQTEHPKLVPRLYVAHRYFSSDDFTAEVDMQVEELSSDFPKVPPDAQQFSELAFRIKDLQVSVFAIPDTGMRLMWRYYKKDGSEVVDNSARDLNNLVEDEVQVPPGRFRVKLKLQALKNDQVDVEAFVNGQRFAHKVLPGLGGQVGKVALGCRNLSCRFDDLSVDGKPAPRPPAKKIDQ